MSLSVDCARLHSARLHSPCLASILEAKKRCQLRPGSLSRKPSQTLALPEPGSEGRTSSSGAPHAFDCNDTRAANLQPRFSPVTMVWAQVRLRGAGRRRGKDLSGTLWPASSMVEAKSSRASGRAHRWKAAALWPAPWWNSPTCRQPCRWWASAPGRCRPQRHPRRS